MLHRILLTLAAVLVTTVAATAGDLKIRFQYHGPPFEPTPIEVTKDVEFCGKQPLVDESLLVNSKNNGIKNVIVYVYTGRDGSVIDQVEPTKRTHILASKNCRFEPHILVMQAGDTLKITNPDPVGHNANVNLLRNTAPSMMVPVYKPKVIQIPQPEPAPIPIECNIHPWMRAYLVVLEHPYAGISNEDGELVIRNLPEKELNFRVWVEAADGALDSVKVNGSEEQWPRNRFNYTIKPGENDMGTVTLTADQLGR